MFGLTDEERAQLEARFAKLARELLTDPNPEGYALAAVVLIFSLNDRLEELTGELQAANDVLAKAMAELGEQVEAHKAREAAREAGDAKEGT